MTLPARQNQAPSFLALLKTTVEDAPDTVKNMVDKAIEIHNFDQLLRFYEVKNPSLARGVLNSIRLAVATKIEADFQAHEMGSTTLDHLIKHAVAFGIIAGAHLAKEKEL